MTSDSPCACDHADDDAVGFVGVCRPVHVAAGARAVLLELLQVGVEMPEDVRLDLPAGFAQLLPVGHLADDGGALAADDVGRMADVAPQLGVGERASRRIGKSGRVRGVADADHRLGPSG